MAPDAPLWAKAGTGMLVAGTLVLLFSAIRWRLSTIDSDRYTEVYPMTNDLAVRAAADLDNRPSDGPLLATSEVIAGYRIVEYRGLVRGNTIRARHVGHDILAAFKSLVGGEISEYTKMMAESREQSLDPAPRRVCRCRRQTRRDRAAPHHIDGDARFVGDPRLRKRPCGSNPDPTAGS